MCDLSCSAEPVQDVAVLAVQPDQTRCLEQGSPKMPRHQSRQTLQLQRNKTNQGKEKMVVRQHTSGQLIKRVAEIYRWLDAQSHEHSDLSGRCDACGRCCDFAQLDHRLFVTTPELMYLAANLCDKDIEPMPTDRCPYHIDGKCTVYKHRFAGCRIFCCNADAAFQSSLSESALKKLKSLCTEFQIPYCYTDLAAALNKSAVQPHHHLRPIKQ
jgi:hypothetical protein